MSELDDLRAYLTSAQVQTSAAVAACGALDDATRGRWYDLAGRIVTFVSTPPIADDPAKTKSDFQLLAEGKALKAELATMLSDLAKAGCGDVAKAVDTAPTPVQAPPPQGTPNPVFHLLDTVPGPLLLLGAYLLYQYLRRR
jgi:hypothetical protein